MTLAYSLLSKYRTELMGIATLMIILCHSLGYGCEFPSDIIIHIFDFGNIGVDIFLFCSGLGCFFLYQMVISIGVG